MEMMKQLNKHQLDFDRASEYVRDNLDNVNGLSRELLNLLDFKKGYFFTLLPDDANFDRIYEFKAGLVLSQNPTLEHIINGHRSTYTWIPHIDEELSDLILKEVLSRPDLSCIMDKVTGSLPKDKSHPYFADNYTAFYDEEVYFFLTKANISHELILRCLKFSLSFWHSLCVFTTADLSTISKTLSLEKIKEICLATELFMVGAYDGEGYVFWEKKEAPLLKSFFEK
jgi:hypothetical protein